MPDMVPPMRQHQSTINAALREMDVGVRSSALDLLYYTCDGSNVVEVVGDLLKYLLAADQSMKDDIVAKIGNLAEKFAPTVHWCVSRHCIHPSIHPWLFSFWAACSSF